MIFSEYKMYVIKNDGRYIRGIVNRPSNLLLVHDKRDAMWLCEEEKDIFLKFVNEFYDADEEWEVEQI